MHEQFKSYRRKTPPLEDKVPDSKTVQWLEPKLVAEIEFRGWTRDKILRQASFKGLRADKPAESIFLETPKVVVEKKITNSDKVLFKKPKTTKGQLVEYDSAISELMLPHIIDRPLSLFRCPNGIDSFCFFQKNKTEGKGLSAKSEIIEQKMISPEGKPAHFMYVQNKAGLLELGQLATIEVHTWGTHRSHPLNPDLMVFDLDPDTKVKFSETVEAAFELRDLLQQLKLESFLKLTGGKGLHLHVPIEPKYTWVQVKEFTRVIAAQMVQQNPKRYVDVMSKSQRAGKIFIDYLRNGYSATAVAPYSVRARAGATIAWPITWREAKQVDPKDFNVHSCLKLAKKRRDPWPDYFEMPQIVELLEKK
jgi:bifunctional non-homologous end joining protein LigD